MSGDSENGFVVAALYKFANLEDYVAMQEPLQTFCRASNIRGTLLLAKEGINGTVCGTREAIDKLLDRLRSDERLKNLDHKESFFKEQPFLRMKVRLKKEIVTLGVEGVSPNNDVGEYVEPKEWNKLISDPQVMLIDTRNKYEIDIGSFKGAVDPKTETFREFPEYVEKNLKQQNKDQKIAMFCTGGIRCEKSTAYLKQLGYKNVYHLKGGILKYLEEVPKKDSMWEGECYVFDHRISVNHDLEKGIYDMCGGCRAPLSPEDKKSELFRQGVECPKCAGKRPEEEVKRAEARQKQIDLAKQRNTTHLGANYDVSKKKQKTEPQEDEEKPMLMEGEN